MRRSRRLDAAFSIAAAAAFSHYLVLVPTSSMTLYTLSAMADTSVSTSYTLLAGCRCVNRARARCQRFASLSSQVPTTNDQNSGCGRKPSDV